MKTLTEKDLDNICQKIVGKGLPTDQVYLYNCIVKSDPMYHASIPDTLINNRFGKIYTAFNYHGLTFYVVSSHFEKEFKILVVFTKTEEIEIDE